MEKKIILIALAVFTMSMLSIADFYNAYAVIVHTSTVSGSSNVLNYDSVSKKFIIRDSQTTPYRTITVVTPTINSTGFLTGATVSTTTLPNPATVANRQYGLGMTCYGTSTCYVLEYITTSRSSGNDRIIGFNPYTGAILSNATIGSLYTGGSTLAQSQDNTNAISNGYFSVLCTTGFARILISPAGLPNIGDCTGINYGTNDLRVSEFNSAHTKLGVLFDNQFSIWTIGSPATRDCNLGSLSLPASPDPMVSVTNATSTYWYAYTSTNQVDLFTSSCVRTVNYVTGHGRTGIRGLNYATNVGQGGFFVGDSGAVSVMNTTASHFSQLVYTINQGIGSSGSSIVSVYGSNVKILGLLGTSTLKLVQIDSAPQNATGGGTGAQNGLCLNIDTNGDGIAGTLLDCTGGASALAGLLPAGQNVTSVGTIIGQGIGLIDPNNDNPRTNGVGLFYMLIVGTFFAIALMTAVHTLHMRGYISASVREIDAIWWLFLVVGTVSVAWYLDWIDDIIFAAMTVGLAGLVAFGALKHFGRI